MSAKGSSGQSTTLNPAHQSPSPQRFVTQHPDHHIPPPKPVVSHPSHHASLPTNPSAPSCTPLPTQIPRPLPPSTYAQLLFLPNHPSNTQHHLPPRSQKSQVLPPISKLNTGGTRHSVLARLVERTQTPEEPLEGRREDRPVVVICGSRLHSLAFRMTAQRRAGSGADASRARCPARTAASGWVALQGVELRAGGSGGRSLLKVGALKYGRRGRRRCHLPCCCMDCCKVEA